jgi:hypothetical protein
MSKFINQLDEVYFVTKKNISSTYVSYALLPPVLLNFLRRTSEQSLSNVV